MIKNVGLFYAWMLGSSFNAFMIMAIQDSYGLDGYIEHLRDEWVDISPAWGISGCIITSLLYAYIVYKYSKIN